MYGVCQPNKYHSKHVCMSTLLVVFVNFFFLPFCIHNTTQHSADLSPWSCQLSWGNESGEPWETMTTTDCLEMRWFHLTGNYSRNSIRNAIFLPSACVLWGRQVDGLCEARRVADEVATCLSVAHLFCLKTSAVVALLTSGASWWSSMLQWGSNCFWARHGARWHRKKKQ